MSDLLALLHSSAGSLSAHSAYSATVSHNLQNANTPGYARQRAELAAVLPSDRITGAFIGRGATIQAVSQVRDRFLEAQVPSALGRAASSTAESAALASVSALDPQGGLGDAISGFYSSLRALSQNASDPGLRQAAVSSARGMALAFNTTARSLADTRSGLDAKIAGDVEEANSLAQQVASYNREIKIARNSGNAEPNDLLDARQRVQDRLSELTGATPVITGEGDVNLVLGQGAPLVTSDRAATLSTLASPTNGGHLAVRLTPYGSTATPDAVGLAGEIGGLLSARDGALLTAEGRLDTLAVDLSNAVNTSHRAGYGLDGVTGRDLFTPGTPATGTAARMTVDATVLADPSRLATSATAASLPGDATNLLQTLATERVPLTGGLDAAGSLSRTISEFGAAAQRMASLSQQDSTMLDNLQGMRESVSGVSIDEELVNMMRAQHAFEAVSKVIQTTDQMLQTLMQLK